MEALKICLCGIVDCTCPPPPKVDEFPIKPPKPSPIDCLGFPQKCCGCIPLRAGVILICIMSFMWAVVELTQSEKLMATIFPNDGALFKYSKVIHAFLIIGYLVACGVFMLGIIVHRFRLIHLYVWIAFVFNCLCIAIDITSAAIQVISTGSVGKRTAMTLAFGVLWHSLFFYFLSVVNSFKYRFWI